MGTLQSKSLKQRLQFILEGGLVVRYHTRPGIKPETDAHHMQRVALLCYILTEGEPSVSLLMAALTHDLAEQSASDVSAHTKHALGLSEKLQKIEEGFLEAYDLNFMLDLTPTERRVLRMADKLDILLWCCAERALGNLNTELIWQRQNALIVDLEPRFTMLSTVLTAIHEIWRDTKDGKQFECLSE